METRLRVRTTDGIDGKDAVGQYIDEIARTPLLDAVTEDELARAIEAETGRSPVLSTTGGTSDARFLKNVCPVIEFGLTNATMHKRDETVAVADLEVLARIYARVAQDALAG